MHSGVNDFTQYDAVLLIGDEALRRNTTGLHGFELVYDLASEWYDWQKLPFVFAVWAVKRSMPDDRKNELKTLLAASLEQAETDFAAACTLHAKRLGLHIDKAVEYLEGFNYRIGERERRAMEVFEHLMGLIEVPQIED
jgi:chorismate dehydratase